MIFTNICKVVGFATPALILAMVGLTGVCPTQTMKVVVNDHNDRVIEKLNRAEEWLQHDCNQHDDTAIQADLDCRNQLRQEIDRGDPWIGRLETLSPFREITGLGERQICGWYMPWETMSPKEMTKNPRVCLDK